MADLLLPLIALLLLAAWAWDLIGGTMQRLALWAMDTAERGDRWLGGWYDNLKLEYDRGQ